LPPRVECQRRKDDHFDFLIIRPIQIRETAAAAAKKMRYDGIRKGLSPLGDTENGAENPAGIFFPTLRRESLFRIKLV
jgi:hypothetical protein